MMSYQFFRQVTPQEVLNCNWQTAEAETFAPNLLKLSSIFNDIALFVSIEILYSPDSMKTQAITTYIKVAQVLKEICDLQSLQAVIAGLNHNTVIRLKPFWEKVDSKIYKQFKKMDSLLGPKHNFEKYKKYFRLSPPPKMPIVAILLKEIKFLYENKRFLDDKKEIINYRLVIYLGERIESLQQQQEGGDFSLLSLPSSKGIAMLFSHWKPDVNEEDMYQQSITCYPVGGAKGERGERGERGLKKVARIESYDYNALAGVYASYGVARHGHGEEEEEETDTESSVREIERQECFSDPSRTTIKKKKESISEI
mmetsp:Transcript_41592/g.57991  ORF Transcript_41592/g.57991 Transcript_41592/m.57991 type:complete len:312 (+) Transcript_41592:656-1591(+)